MAIMGFLVHTLPGHSTEVESIIKGLPQVTTYGVHEACYVVAVADDPDSEMEGLLEKIHRMDGVLTCYVTSMHMEDVE